MWEIFTSSRMGGFGIKAGQNHETQDCWEVCPGFLDLWRIVLLMASPEQRGMSMLMPPGESKVGLIRLHPTSSPAEWVLGPNFPLLQ